MGIGDMVNQAKDMVGADKVDSAVDQAADMAKAQTPDVADSAIDMAADKAKDVL